MLSIHCLWRAITSVRPRYAALLHCPRRQSLVGPVITWRSIKQLQSRHISDVKVDQFPESLKKSDGSNGQPEAETAEDEGDQSEEDVEIILNGDNNTASHPDVESSAILEETALEAEEEALVEEAFVEEATNKKADKTADEKALDLRSVVTASMASLPHPVVIIATLGRTYKAQEADKVPIEQMRPPIARAITASSFTSLCIRPRPHVMFNMTLPSTTYEALVSCKDFNVHILTADKFGAQIANIFTRGNRRPPPRLGDPKGPIYPFDIDADLGILVGLRSKKLPYSIIANREEWHIQYQTAKKAALQARASLDSDVEPLVQESSVTDDPVEQFHPVPCIHNRGIIEVLHCRLVSVIDPQIAGAGQNAIIIGDVVDRTYATEGNTKPKGEHVALGYANRKYRSPGHPLKPRGKKS